jgi:hypothetical protein
MPWHGQTFEELDSDEIRLNKGDVYRAKSDTICSSEDGQAVALTRFWNAVHLFSRPSLHLHVGKDHPCHPKVARHFQNLVPRDLAAAQGFP